MKKSKIRPEKITAKAAARAAKSAERMAKIKSGQTLGGIAKQIADNAKDRNFADVSLGQKFKGRFKGMGAIKQAGQTGRRYITAKYGADKTIEKYRQNTAQRESDNRAKVQMAALERWNGVINQTPTDQNVEQGAGNAPTSKDRTNQTTGTPIDWVPSFIGG